MAMPPLLPAGWDAKAAGDRVLAELVNICAPQVKGAHDSDFLIIDGKAHVVYMANDVQPGEAPDWPFVYCALSVVDVASGDVETIRPFAVTGQAYANTTLPAGSIFVPRLVRKDAQTLRCFFASSDPGKRQSQVWRIDYAPAQRTFADTVFPMELETDQGLFPMQPKAFHAHQAAKGFSRPAADHGIYAFDLKPIDGTVYAVINNFPGAQLALATLNATMERFTLIGDFFQPLEARLTEAAVHRLPNGSWLAISRQDGGDGRYMFTTSPDGRAWTPHAFRDDVPSGGSSKPTLDRFGDVYYMGWQDGARINNVSRSIFNVAVSRDGVSWERKYRFETEKSFQYPTFRAYGGAVYLTVTQGDSSGCRKERIMFGKLEDLANA